MTGEVYGKHEPCDKCGRPKSEYVDLGTHGQYRCWWCEKRARPVTPGDVRMNCPTCGAGSSFTIPVWKDMVDYKLDHPPDYLGCTECETMRPFPKGDGS